MKLKRRTRISLSSVCSKIYKIRFLSLFKINKFLSNLSRQRFSSSSFSFNLTHKWKTLMKTPSNNNNNNEKRKQKIEAERTNRVITKSSFSSSSPDFHLIFVPHRIFFFFFFIYISCFNIIKLITYVYFIWNEKREREKNRSNRENILTPFNNQKKWNHLSSA